jgi:hypothetical protein
MDHQGDHFHSGFVPQQSRDSLVDFSFFLEMKWTKTKSLPPFGDKPE